MPLVGVNGLATLTGSLSTRSCETAMHFINSTRMPAGYTMGMEPCGRELLVVVVKGTFRLPARGEEPVLHQEQMPLTVADTFTGAPGSSAPYYETDFAPRKAHCDVLLLGSAYAPGGRPATRISVGLRVGPVAKEFAVVGNRHWDVGIAGIRATPPQPFKVQRISYDVAFGGADQRANEPIPHAVYSGNPVGRGFCQRITREQVNGKPLPNTEELNRPVTRPDEKYRPMAFGPIGRGWEPRFRYAGTYDDTWIQKHCPFLPLDFDERYYQAAPIDQQLRHLVGQVNVHLINLTPDGTRTFKLPNFEAPVHVFPRHGGREDYNATLDTIVLEPDLDRFMVSWRVCRPVKRSILEIAQVLVGRKGRQWWQQREEVMFPIPLPIASTARSAAGSDTA